MPLNRIRRGAGFWLGECIQSALLSLGLIAFTLFALNGFGFRRTIHFIDNFTRRFIAADPANAASFAAAIQILILALAIIILGIRALDRHSKRGAST